MNDISKVTTNQPFDTMDSVPLFSVNAGVPIEDALLRAEQLMRYVESLAAADALIDKNQERAVIQHLSEIARALVKASHRKAA
ncbi:MAG: DUF3077 domain-containing protein [Pseudomonas sp.]|uniref:DUF3077 domain-containing protein n=1 Tax=Pseudomonas sp. TaxID=306 RepID=UPI0030EFB1CA